MDDAQLLRYSRHVLLDELGPDAQAKFAAAHALIVGIGTVVAPWFIMQPAMGAGIAASRTPRPAEARLHSLLTHAVFGVALYLAGWIVSGVVG